ncbi:uncharacterized protein LOC143538322 [Bidens hawaiensis]|uniref:uncharacterized protein LOC143538322 n=1 Tax=Bidens hawaiensis TaxID=980011 RepID=UPI00404B166F
MGRVYVEVFRCKKQEYYNAVAAEYGYVFRYYDNGYRASHKWFKMKFKLTSFQKNNEVLEFTNLIRLLRHMNDEKVHIDCRLDGKVTGEAYVTFESAKVVKQAMCKDRLMIGKRYVKLFVSTLDEARW